MTLPASLEALKLRSQIAAAISSDGWDAPAARAAGLAHIRKKLDKFKARARGCLEGAGGGAVASQVLCEGVRVCLHALFDSMASEDLVGSRGVSLCATGGFGAGQLAPASDVDLLFIKPGTSSEETDRFLERVLYALWDLKIDVGGGACRTIQDTIELVEKDASERTALLSLRAVAGDRDAPEELVRRFRQEIVKGHETEFVEAKLRERDARIENSGRSRYSVEPNLKSAKGGLRDLQLMRWLALFLYGADAFERWVGTRLLSLGDVDRYIAADDFLWTVRFHLHDLSGSKNDRLSFDLQPEIAQRMGYEDGADESAVERFMGRYFRTAMDVGGLTRLVCAKLEADAWKAKPKGLARFLPGSEATDDPEIGAFVLRDGRLDFAHPKQITDDPVQLLEFFHIASSRQLDLHPEAMARVGRTLHHVDDGYRSDPRAARAFFAVLLDSPAPMAVLRLMTETGLLGQFIPEFGDIVGRTQFNMYHHYTVDEHTLQAVGWLREIEDGLHPEMHPLTTIIAPLVKNRRALHLAILLHDTGKGSGDQCDEGAIRALSVCRRLGLDESECELVSWLVQTHLLMSDTAQRRDLGDPKTVRDFAKAVGNLEKLRLLTLLTTVDIRAVGPGVWNGWKGQLMRELYGSTEALLHVQGDETDHAGEVLAQRADKARASLKDRMERVNPDFAQWWIEEVPDSYWTAFAEEDRFRHAAFARQIFENELLPSAAIRVDKRRAATEVMIWAPDRERIFADLAAAIAEMRADVVGASITTTSSEHVFDIFHVQDATGQPFGADDDFQMTRLLQHLKEVALGEKPVRRRRRLALKQRDAAFRVTPHVAIFNDISEYATVIETTGRDRPGLMAELADVLADERLSLISAQIDGYGERATDVFYVTVRGEKLEDEHLKARVIDGLLAVFTQGESELDETAAKRGIARARASALR
ncbi:MAG: [protein-PII] uridylyltransferase [Maricaulis sp.]|nr:[protein-PII] uridylyltransferase [Maricaulis sp.]